MQTSEVSIFDFGAKPEHLNCTHGNREYIHPIAQADGYSSGLFQPQVPAPYHL